MHPESPKKLGGRSGRSGRSTIAGAPKTPKAKDMEALAVHQQSASKIDRTCFL